MPQRYKVRLGDGTVVAVDQDGLKTWAADRRAMAQAAGSPKWRPLREVLAEEESAARLAQALVPPPPREEAVPPRPAVANVPLDRGAPTEAPVGLVSRPDLQVLAADPSSSDPETPPVPYHELPVIPLKPIADEPVQRTVWAGRDDTFEDESPAEVPRWARLDGPVLTVLETFGGFLSRCVDPLTPLVDDWSSRWRTARRRRPAANAGDAPRPSEAAPRPEIGGDRAAPEPAPRVRLAERAARWLRDWTARFPRITRSQGAPSLHLLDAPALPRSRSPEAREPRQPPPPVSELPVLRFAENDEPAESGDLYDGEEPLGYHPVWLWTKRALLMGGFVALAVWGFLERDAWFPKAAELGQAMFTEVDERVRSRERAEQRERAVAEAAARLPHLTPETIQLIFSRSATGVAEPSQVFALAREAAERGRTALPRTEADMLAALERELLATLRPSEREQVRTYDQTRTWRVAFPFENAAAMELVARGARALSQDRLERLRALTQQAVAAGLDAERAASTPAAG